MNRDAATGPYLIAKLKTYQDLCQAYDIAAAVKMFALDGIIEEAEEQVVGEDALRAAHEFDMGAQNQIVLRDFVVDGDHVSCTFVNCHELHRILGIDAIHRRVEITFTNGLIQKFSLLRPDDQDLERFRAVAGPFFTWARERHPEELAKMRSFNYEGGRALFKLAHAWRDHLAGATTAW
jgi:hypothetical protein